MKGQFAWVRLLRQDAELLDGDAPAVDTRKLVMADESGDRFLDGPVTRRIAVVDLDPDTGLPAADRPRFVRNADGTGGKYPTGAYDEPTAIAVNAFGVVFDTVRMAEERGALGRRIRWAFGREQLLVVPRAAEERNAFYDPRSGSIQLGWFRVGDRTVYTALSRDILAHETGHAILDAICPALRDAVTLQARAIHEALADVVALFMALRNQQVCRDILDGNEQPLRRSNAFSTIAREFGQAVPGEAGQVREALRNLHNTATIDSVRAQGPHELSTVLSGLIYDVFVELYDWFHAINRTVDDSPHAAAKALGTTSAVLRRLVLRGVDYLPPGEVVFADVVRSMLCADRAVDRDEGAAEIRATVADHAVARGIVGDVSELAASSPPALVDVPGLADLRDSDRVAYAFVEGNRGPLDIPEGASFEVLPRIDATKQVRSQNSEDAFQRELIVKVAWRIEEPYHVPGFGTQTRRIRTGCTLAFHWDNGRLLAHVRSEVGAADHSKDRDRVMDRLAADGALVRPGSPASGPRLVFDGSVVEVRDTLALLHHSEAT